MSADAHDGGQTDEGRAAVYHGSAMGLGAPVWNVESDQATSLLGYSLGTTGDVNGDGFSDVIVGAVGYDDLSTDEGKVRRSPPAGCERRRLLRCDRERRWLRRRTDR